MFKACGEALSSEKGQGAWTSGSLGPVGPPQVKGQGGE